MAGRVIGLPKQMPNAITFTNAKFQTTHGFLVQDGKDVVFQNARIEAAIGDPLVLDNAFVRFNGVSKSGSSGGPPDVFYAGN